MKLTSTLSSRPSPELEVIRLDEEPVLKTGDVRKGVCGFESHGFRSQSADDACRARSEKTTRSCGPAAKAAPPQGDDRWFESTQDHLSSEYANGRAARSAGCVAGSIPASVLARHCSPTAEAVVSKATQCEFESHQCQLKNQTRPRRAATSARHPVTVEIVVSHQIWGAWEG